MKLLIGLILLVNCAFGANITSDNSKIETYIEISNSTSNGYFFNKCDSNGCQPLGGPNYYSIDEVGEVIKGLKHQATALSIVEGTVITAATAGVIILSYFGYTDSAVQLVTKSRHMAGQLSAILSVGATVGVPLTGILLTKVKGLNAKIRKKLAQAIELAAFKNEDTSIDSKQMDFLADLLNELLLKKLESR